VGGGNRLDRARSDLCEGTIPAWAGETLLARSQPPRAARQGGGGGTIPAWAGETLHLKILKYLTVSNSSLSAPSFFAKVCANERWP
jgi:hypothetical protein